MKGKPGNPLLKRITQPSFRGGPGSGRKSIKGRKRGRKTAREEGERYEIELDLLYEPSDIEKIKEKIRQKKPISIRDIMLLKEAGGNDRLIAAHYGKVVPDTIDLTSKGKRIGILDDQRIAKIARRILDGGAKGKTISG